MNYAIEILEAELKRLQNMTKGFCYTSTGSHIDYNILNNISYLKKAIALIKRF